MEGWAEVGYIDVITPPERPRWYSAYGASASEAEERLRVFLVQRGHLRVGDVQIIDATSLHVPQVIARAWCASDPAISMLQRARRVDVLGGLEEERLHIPKAVGVARGRQ